MLLADFFNKPEHLRSITRLGIEVQQRGLLYILADSTPFNRCIVYDDGWNGHLCCHGGSIPVLSKHGNNKNANKNNAGTNHAQKTQIFSKPAPANKGGD